MNENSKLNKYWQLLNDQKAVLITASNRQSRHWQQQYNQWQSRTRDVWHSATIFSFGQWLQQLFQSQDISSLRNRSSVKELPVLLNKQHSLWLWEFILRQQDVDDYLISVKATAKKA